MILNPVRYAQHYFSHARIIDLYKDIHAYLPPERRRDFMRSWVIQNLILGPRKRARFERKYGCTLPGVINISPSQKCNLCCDGCYAADYSRSAEMTTGQISAIVGQAKSLGIHFIGILGGEPLLRRDLFDVIEANRDVAFRISTNGTVVDGGIIDALKRCGNIVLFLSVEGFDSDTDAWRGGGVYQKIIGTMSVLREERILFGFSALVHAQNADTVVSREFLDTMQAAGCRFGIFFPYGPTGSRARYDLAMTEERVDILYARISGFLRDYTMLLRREGYYPNDPKENSPADQGCRAGVSIHITPEGYVEPCNGLQFYTENVFRKELGEIFRSPFYNEIFSWIQAHGKRCAAMFDPDSMLSIVKKYGAQGSHPQALSSYSYYAGRYGRHATTDANQPPVRG